MKSFLKSSLIADENRKKVKNWGTHCWSYNVYRKLFCVTLLWLQYVCFATIVSIIILLCVVHIYGFYLARSILNTHLCYCKENMILIGLYCWVLLVLCYAQISSCDQFLGRLYNDNNTLLTCQHLNVKLCNTATVLSLVMVDWLIGYLC